MTHKIIYLLFCHFTGRMSTYCLKHTGQRGSLSLYMTCQHWTTTDKYCRYIHSGCRHQQSRYILITVWHHNQCIKGMGHCHTLCRICNQISCYERILHSYMPHGNSITHCDCREHNRCSTSHSNAQLNCFYYLIQIHMPWYDLIIRTDNTY